MSFLDNCIETTRGLAKILLQSRGTRLKRRERGGRIIVMGNGPSLAGTIRDHMDLLQRTDTLAVNFAANDAAFREIKPRYYLLADPHFFSERTDANLMSLWANLSDADWDLTIIVPHKFQGKTYELLRLVGGSQAKVATFNAVGIEGFDVLSNTAYWLKLGMPRPRNVLIPAIMVAIWLKYKEIVIVGADHSWMESLRVNDHNQIMAVQHHFYDEPGEEECRVAEEYRGYHIHQIVQSMAVAFKSYHQIANFASHNGVKIYNATPGSYIDAFERIKL